MLFRSRWVEAAQRVSPSGCQLVSSDQTSEENHEKLTGVVRSCIESHHSTGKLSPNWRAHNETSRKYFEECQTGTNFSRT
jgi:hypothetical protein